MSSRLSPTLTNHKDMTVSGLVNSPSVDLIGSDYPLIVAIHGGTYSSAYFDLPGYSLLQRAEALGLPVIALDRPGYGTSSPLADSKATVVGNAEVLDDSISELWRTSVRPARGVVLIGHSIGGAVAVAIAARRPTWPLLGIAISGVGLEPPPEVVEAWAALPEVTNIQIDPALKDAIMFGPDWTLEADQPDASHVADAPAPRAELIDIATNWPSKAAALAAQVSVPVHYRQAQFEKLWLTNRGAVARFGNLFSASPLVDAQEFTSAGHCIDFHRIGAAFQVEQLAFALRCSMVSKH